MLSNHFRNNTATPKHLNYHFLQLVNLSILRFSYAPLIRLSRDTWPRGTRHVTPVSKFMMHRWMAGDHDVTGPYQVPVSSKSNSYHGEPYIPADVFNVSITHLSCCCQHPPLSIMSVLFGHIFKVLYGRNVHQYRDTIIS